MAYVYKHIRKNTNEIFYIGIGKSEKRLKSYRNRNTYWRNIVDKYGFDYEIIEDNLTWEQACELEIKLIKEYGRKDLGLGNLVNMTDGGDGQFNFSEETRKKCGNSFRGKKLTEEHKKNIKKGMKPLSEEQRKKISEKHKNKIVSEETRKKLSIANKNCVPPSRKGAVLGEETKQLLRDKNKGKKLSDETKIKISIASRSRSEETKQKVKDGLKKMWERRKNNFGN